MSPKKVLSYTLFILLLVTAVACGGGEAAGDDVDPYAESEAAVEESQEIQEEDVATVDAEWVEFVSEAGNFTARFPGEPTEQVQPAPNTDIETDVHMFLVEDGPTAYMISYNDYPIALTNGTARTEIMESAFDGAREAMMGSVSGTLVAEEDISLAGYPGRQLEFDIAESLIPGGGEGVVRMYAVNERFYQIAVIGPEGQPSAEEIDAFLASFDFLEAPVVSESDTIETVELAVSDSEEPVVEEETVENVETASDEEAIEADVAVANSEEAEVAPAEELETATDALAAPNEVNADGTITSAITGDTYQTDFPFPEDAYYFFSQSGGAEDLNFQTDLSVAEVLDFYRAAMSEQGLTERAELTQVNGDEMFSLVFDGSPTGKAVVIQAVLLEDGASVSLRFEAV